MTDASTITLTVPNDAAAPLNAEAVASMVGQHPMLTRDASLSSSPLGRGEVTAAALSDDGATISLTIAVRNERKPGDCATAFGTGAAGIGFAADHYSKERARTQAWLFSAYPEGDTRRPRT